MSEFDEREQKEIRLALFYANNLAHGTAGHNRLMLLAKMAGALGFYLGNEMALHRYGDPFNVKIPPDAEDHEALSGARLGVAMGNEVMRGFIDGLTEVTDK